MTPITMGDAAPLPENICAHHCAVSHLTFH